MWFPYPCKLGTLVQPEQLSELLHGEDYIYAEWEYVTMYMDSAKISHSHSEGDNVESWNSKFVAYDLLYGHAVTWKTRTHVEHAYALQQKQYMLPGHVIHEKRCRNNTLWTKLVRCKYFKLGDLCTPDAGTHKSKNNQFSVGEIWTHTCTLGCMQGARTSR